MLSLLGFYIIYSGRGVTQTGRSFHIPSTSKALLGCFFFGMSTLTRSTGVLLSIYIAFFVGNSFLTRYNRIWAAIRTVLTALMCILIMVMPLLIVIYIQPYLLHCAQRFVRGWQGTIPEWCSDVAPNVYTYI